MPVDVLPEAIIDRPRDQVTAYAGNPDNAPEGYVNIQSVEWKTDAPVEPQGPRPSEGDARSEAGRWPVK